jgi:hypothetical protein
MLFGYFHGIVAPAGATPSLHQHGRDKNILPHDGGNHALPRRRFGLVMGPVAQDQKDGDR